MYKERTYKSRFFDDDGHTTDEAWDIVHNVTSAAGFDDYYTNGTDIWCNGEMGVYVINDYLLEKSCNNEYTADYIRDAMIEVYCQHLNSYQPKGVNHNDHTC